MPRVQQALVFEPYWFINDFDGVTVATTRASPWRYDSFAPTPAALLGIKQQPGGRRA